MDSLQTESTDLGVAAATAVESDRIRFLYRNAPTGIGVNVAVAVLLVAALWHQVPQRHLLLWLLALLLASALRGLHLWCYRRRHPAPAELPRWRDEFLWWTALSGAV
jgi:hypothetical protein